MHSNDVPPSLLGTLVVALLALHAPAQVTFSEQSVAAGVHVYHGTVGLNDAVVGDELFTFMTGGVAVLDYDNDGWQDLFTTGGGRHLDRLWHNNGDGTFSDATGSAGLIAQHQGSGVAIGDYDKNGYQDIFVTSHGHSLAVSPGKHRLYRNNGDGTFTESAAAAGVDFASPGLVDGWGACFGDYDLDGDLDLFVCGWRGHRENPDGLGNRLFENQGAGTFVDVTQAAGVFEPELWAFSSTFADMNGDRYPELLISADFGTSRYFVNNANGLDFTEYTASSGCGLDENGMGSAVGDVNNDGLLDWYVTSIYESDPAAGRNGNRLYLNQGNDTFTEVAKTAGVDDGRWGWGTVMIDVDLDGWLDLVETGGWFLPMWVATRSLLWLNNGDMTFTESSVAMGFDHYQSGRALVNLDYDNDGDQDLVIASNQGYLELFRCDQGAGGNGWLRIFLDTSGQRDLAPNGVGSTVRIATDLGTQMRYVDAGSHFLGTSETSAHFGLGQATAVNTVTVEWTDGTTTVLNNVGLNQTITIAP